MNEQSIENRFLLFCEYLELLRNIYSEQDFKYIIKLFEMELKFYE